MRPTRGGGSGIKWGCIREKNETVPASPYLLVEELIGPGKSARLNKLSPKKKKKKQNNYLHHLLGKEVGCRVAWMKKL